MPITFAELIDALETANETNGKLDIIRQYIAENPADLHKYFIDIKNHDSLYSDDSSADSNLSWEDRDHDIENEDVVIRDVYDGEEITTTDVPEIEKETSSANVNPDLGNHNHDALTAHNLGVNDAIDVTNRTQQTLMDIALIARNKHSIALLFDLGVDINQIIHKSRDFEFNYLTKLLTESWDRNLDDINLVPLLSRSKTKLHSTILQNVIWRLYADSAHYYAQALITKNIDYERVYDAKSQYAYLAICTLSRCTAISLERIINFIFNQRKIHPGTHDLYMMKQFIDSGLDINFKNSQGISLLHNLLESSMINPQYNIDEIVKLFLNHPELDLAQLNANGKTIFEYKELPESIHKLLVDKQFESIHEQRLGNSSFFSRAPRDVIEYVLKPMVTNRRIAISPSDSLDASSEDLQSESNNSSDEKTAADAAAPPIETEDDIPTKNPSSPRRKN